MKSFAYLFSVCETIRRTKLLVTEMVYNAPGVLDYFLSSEWPKFVTFLENDVRCVVDKTMVSI